MVRNGRINGRLSPSSDGCEMAGKGYLRVHRDYRLVARAYTENSPPLRNIYTGSGGTVTDDIRPFQETPGKALKAAVGAVTIVEKGHSCS